MTNDLCDFSLTRLAQGLRAGEFSSRELTQAFQARIDRLEPQLHAFINLTPVLALAQADAADRRIAAWRADPSEPLAPLAGIPLAVKDVLCVDGARCTCGSKILETFAPSYTATAVKRLLDAGMVVLGKTNTDEFAMGSSTENSAYGATRNPWDTGRVPGGSSGGSAAAVAARLAPAGLGTDTGGSVRQPAALCGVSGLKPSYGRVSRYGLVAFGSSLDVVGAFGASAADLALIFQAMAGYDPLDSTCLEQPAPIIALPDDPRQALEGLRIGVPKEYFELYSSLAGQTGEALQPEVRQCVLEAIQLMERQGARIVPISLPTTEHALPVYYLLAPAEASANLARFDGIRYGPRAAAGSMWEVFYNTRGELFGPEVKRRIMLGAYALSTGYYDAYYGQAQKVRTLIKNDFERAFGEVDLIAAPAAPTTAFRFGEHADNPLAMYMQDIFTLPASLAGIPGVSIPAGFDAQGLPVGLQLLAPALQEARLLAAAHAYQLLTGWHLRRPAT
ncbi:MAG: Asp-tRNA(Asn)/Glu-tRNA(Gln) amidotransferase subunit GatA [Chloroflexota bacterium]